MAFVYVNRPRRKSPGFPWTGVLVSHWPSTPEGLGSSFPSVPRGNQPSWCVKQEGSFPPRRVWPSFGWVYILAKGEARLSPLGILDEATAKSRPPTLKAVHTTFVTGRRGTRARTSYFPRANDAIFMRGAGGRVRSRPDLRRHGCTCWAERV